MFARPGQLRYLRRVLLTGSFVLVLSPRALSYGAVVRYQHLHASKAA